MACDGGDLGLSPGEQVLVDDPDGRCLGAVEGRPVVMLHDGEPLPTVVRRAAKADRRNKPLTDVTLEKVTFQRP